MYNEHYFEDDRDPDMDPVIYSGSLRHIQDHLESVLDQLYGNGYIDLGILENSLDEVVHGLGMCLPINDLLIERKRPIHTFSHQLKFDVELCREMAS